MSATGLETPTWVQAAMAVLTGSDNLPSIGLRPSADKARLSASKVDVTLGTLRQEKGKTIASDTCPKCPYRWKHSKEYVPKYVDYNQRDGSRWHAEYTVRCRSCNTISQRKKKRKKLNKAILNAAEYFDTHCAFVTLTIPNLPYDAPLAAESRSLKARIAKLRRREKYKKIVLGGVDVVENTVNFDWDQCEVTLNLHHHGIWVMNGYYQQADLQNDWGHRAWIEKVRKPHAVMRYLTAYVSKAPIYGIRCLETFKACRGAAASAIDDYLVNLKECDDVEHA